MSLASGMTITPADREAWIEGRTRFIGASEAASACGLNRYQSPLALYLAKTGQSPPIEPSIPMRAGTCLESLIGELFEEETGLAIDRTQVFLVSDEHPFMSATLDAVTTDRTIAEFKSIGNRSEHELGEEGSDQLPDSWVIQATHQMIVARTSVAGSLLQADHVRFGVLVGKEEFRSYRVDWDADLAAKIIGIEAQFWRCVVDRDALSVSRPSDASLLHLLYPATDGPLIDADDELEDMVRDYKRHAETTKEADAAKGLAKAHILERLGEASGARLADGTKVTRKVIEVGEAVITRKASRYAQLYFSKGRP